MGLSDLEKRLMALVEGRNIGTATLWAVLWYCKGTPPPSFFGRSAEWYAETLSIADAQAKALAKISENRPSADFTAESPYSIYSAFDSRYPRKWTTWKAAPPVVYTTLYKYPILTNVSACILSSHSGEGKAAEGVKEAAERGVAAGYTLVAGHNKPPYQLALLAAKRHNAPSVMVLDRGLYCAFDDDLRRDPVPAARIWGYAFDTERSIALSPFRLRDKWIGRNSQYRDAMVAALSDVVIAVGVREGGVMHGVCRDALARGQTVYADADCYPFLAEHGALPWRGELPSASRTAFYNGGQPAKG